MTNDMTYDDALAVFLSTDASYAGGLANHGPMAVEALLSLGQEHQIGAFVAQYRQRLEDPTDEIVAAPADWRGWLHPQLPDLVTRTSNRAGHGLLRVAHAVRGIERVERTGAPSPAQLHELGIAVDYWRRGGPGVPGPAFLSGKESADEWFSSLGRLPADERFDGMLTVTLSKAAAMPEFVERLGALAPAEDPTSTLDVMAAAAAAAFARNTAMNAFALLHGMTVSSMAHVLLDHLDESGTRALESAVVGFVAAAVVGFDDHAAGASVELSVSAGVPDPAILAARSAETLEDHTIKFADACIAVSARTENDAPLAALQQQIDTPYGL